MAVTRVNTPVIVSTTVSPTSATATWGGYTPAAGDLLAAVVTADAATSVGTTAQNAGTSGWTKQFEVWNSTTNAGHSLVALWTKTAAGSDAWPQFTSTLSGTAVLSVTMVALRGANNASPVDTSGTFSSSGSGTGTATVTSESVTTSGNVSASGEYALFTGVRERTAGTTTITASGTGYTLGTSDGATSQVGHTALTENAAPTPGAATTGGIALSGTGTSAYGAALLVVFAAAPAPETSPALEMSGFTISGPASGDTINSVTVAVTEHQSNAAQAACTFELWDYSGTPAQIGATQTGTASTSTSNVSSATFTGVTYAQLATLRVRVYGHADTGTSYVESADGVSLTVNYTPAVTAGIPDLITATRIAP